MSFYDSKTNNNIQPFYLASDNKPKLIDNKILKKIKKKKAEIKKNSYSNKIKDSCLAFMKENCSILLIILLLIILLIFRYIEVQKNIFGAYQLPGMPFLSLGSLIIDFGLIGLIGFILILFLCFRKIQIDFDFSDTKILEKSMIFGAIFTALIDNHGIGMWVTWFTLGFFFANNSLKLTRS